MQPSLARGAGQDDESVNRTFDFLSEHIMPELRERGLAAVG